MQFDWQTEENVDWENGDAEPTAVEKPVSFWRSRLFYVMATLGLLLVVGTAVAYQFLANRVEKATAETEAEVLRSHLLVETAAFEGDQELFSTVLSGRDPEWALALEKLVHANSYQDRQAFGLMGVAEANATAVITTTINPNFTSAELITEYPYSYHIGNGLTEMVWLQTTAVYRPSSSRWLLSPPQEDFWGESLSKEGFFSSLRFPARDQAIAERLALDMDTTLAAICAHAAFHCPDDMKVELVFSSDPTSLIPPTSTVKFISEGTAVVLPTPTLVGLPRDEAAYQALTRGYQLQVVQPLLLELAPFDLTSLADSLFLDSWLAWQFDWLALRPYPVSFPDLALLQGVSLDEANRSWQLEASTATNQQKLMAYTFLQFVLRDLALPTTVFANMNSQTMADTDGLLQKAGFSWEAAEERWQQYLLKQPLN